MSAAHETPEVPGKKPNPAETPGSARLAEAISGLGRALALTKDLPETNVTAESLSKVTPENQADILGSIREQPGRVLAALNDLFGRDFMGAYSQAGERFENGELDEFAETYKPYADSFTSAMELLRRLENLNPEERLSDKTQTQVRDVAVLIVRINQGIQELRGRADVLEPDWFRDVPDLPDLSFSEEPTPAAPEAGIPPHTAEAVAAEIPPERSLEAMAHAEKIANLKSCIAALEIKPEEVRKFSRELITKIRDAFLGITLTEEEIALLGDLELDLTYARIAGSSEISSREPRHMEMGELRDILEEAVKREVNDPKKNVSLRNLNIELIPGSSGGEINVGCTIAVGNSDLSARATLGLNSPVPREIFVESRKIGLSTALGTRKKIDEVFDDFPYIILNRLVKDKNYGSGRAVQNLKINDRKELEVVFAPVVIASLNADSPQTKGMIDKAKRLKGMLAARLLEIQSGEAAPAAPVEQVAVVATETEPPARQAENLAALAGMLDTFNEEALNTSSGPAAALEVLNKLEAMRGNLSPNIQKMVDAAIKAMDEIL